MLSRRLRRGSHVLGLQVRASELCRAWPIEFFSDWKSLSGGTLRALVGCLNDGMDFSLGAAPAIEKDSGPRRLGPQYESGHKMSALHPVSAVR